MGSEYGTFQFQKVRLKDETHPYGAGQTAWFQFQKVRLKGKEARRRMDARREFQFQKVRLKVIVGGVRDKVRPVSIPKGSIKSVIFLDDLVLLHHVSIPKGSIKRSCCSTLSAPSVQFQFQKVRLKAG